MLRSSSVRLQYVCRRCVITHLKTHSKRRLHQVLCVDVCPLPTDICSKRSVKTWCVPVELCSLNWQQVLWFYHQTAHFANTLAAQVLSKMPLTSCNWTMFLESLQEQLRWMQASVLVPGNAFRALMMRHRALQNVQSNSVLHCEQLCLIISAHNH